MTAMHLQALQRFESMSSIKIQDAASIEDLALLAVELEQEAGAWRVCINLAALSGIDYAIQPILAIYLAKACQYMMVPCAAACACPVSCNLSC